MDINKLIQRQHFLLRAIEFKNVDPIEGHKEIDKLEKEIRAKTKELLLTHQEKLKAQVDIVKTEIKFDGDFKRSIASLLIEILEKMLSAKEIKGVFRQGYKIMRQKC